MQAHSEGETLTAGRCDECEVTTRWLGFYRVWQGSGEVFDTVDLFLPDVQFNTQVTCLAAPQHALEHPPSRCCTLASVPDTKQTPGTLLFVHPAPLPHHHGIDVHQFVIMTRRT